MKVLLLRFSSLGDVVLATAAVEALRADRPDVEVHVLTKPAFREIFLTHPGVAGCVDWDPEEGIVALARKIRRERYDWIVDLHGTLRARALRALTPGARWTRYRKGTLRRRLAVWLRNPDLLDDTHVVDRYIAALGRLGVRRTRRLPRLYPGEAHRGRVSELLAAAGWDGDARLVALAPGARWPTKAWPEEHWRALAGRLQGGGALPVVVGGPEDRELADRILAGGRGANLAGRTTILETAAALAWCEALVTNDSAPMHMATAVGTRVVALFGPTVRGFGFYPLGPADTVVEREIPCRPCSLHGRIVCPSGPRTCLDSIRPEEILAEVERPGGRI
ncbi:glycosyltransferase family 9 protein [Deferrisoma palaeochoriense]